MRLNLDVLKGIGYAELIRRDSAPVLDYLRKELYGTENAPVDPVDVYETQDWRRDSNLEIKGQIKALTDKLDSHGMSKVNMRSRTFDTGGGGVLKNLKKHLETFCYALEKKGISDAQKAIFNEKVFNCDGGAANSMREIIDEISVNSPKSLFAYAKGQLIDGIIVDYARENPQSLHMRGPAFHTHDIQILRNSIAETYNLRKVTKEEDHYVVDWGGNNINIFSDLASENQFKNDIKNKISSEGFCTDLIETICVHLTTKVNKDQGELYQDMPNSVGMPYVMSLMDIIEGLGFKIRRTLFLNGEELEDGVIDIINSTAKEEPYEILKKFITLSLAVAGIITGADIPSLRNELNIPEDEELFDFNLEALPEDTDDQDQDTDDQDQVIEINQVAEIDEGSIRQLMRVVGFIGTIEEFLAQQREAEDARRAEVERLRVEREAEDARRAEVERLRVEREAEDARRIEEVETRRVEREAEDARIAIEEIINKSVEENRERLEKEAKKQKELNDKINSEATFKLDHGKTKVFVEDSAKKVAEIITKSFVKVSDNAREINPDPKSKLFTAEDLSKALLSKEISSKYQNNKVMQEAVAILKEALDSVAVSYEEYSGYFGSYDREVEAMNLDSVVLTAYNAFSEVKVSGKSLSYDECLFGAFEIAANV